MLNIKKIGILTSGGDCSGLNAAIRAVTFAALTKGWEVYGIHHATDGLFARPMMYQKLTQETFNFPYARLGGTMLGTNNSGNPHLQKTADGSMETLTDEQLVERFKSGVKELGIDGIVLIGGDGSTAIVGRYCQEAKVPMIAIPKTIDNDAPATEMAVGFATARNVVMDALDKLDTTANSHERFIIAEVMGRGAGHLALEGAIAGMADVCLIPEIPYTYEGIVNKLRQIRASGRKSGLIVVAEGVKTLEGKHAFSSNGKTFGGISNYFVEKLAAEPDNFNVRATILGHVQRAGDPVAEDRILASALGTKAVELLAKGDYNRVVILKDGKVTHMGLKEVLKIANTPVDPKGDMVKVARGLGMYIGE